MTALFEESLLFVVLGIITSVILGFAWLQTGRRQFAVALAVVIVLTVLVVVIERNVVTDREEVDAVLRQAAREVQQNDLRGLLPLIHAQAPEIRAQAEAEFPKYAFKSVDINRNLKITVNPSAQPGEAIAKFNVVVIGSHRDGSVEQWKAPRYVTVTFRKQGNDWRIFAYEHVDAQQGLLNRTE